MRHMQQAVALQPEDGWVFVVDQLNTHKSVGLVPNRRLSSALLLHRFIS